jgi:acetoacetate decarboxylase
MARLRYVSDPSAPRAPSLASHSVSSLRALYETEKEIAAALLPRPLVPAASPEVFVQFAQVAMHRPSGETTRVGAATVGVACAYEGRPGYYVLAMPMEGEAVVIAGREKYGEPKKLAETRFSLDCDHVNAQVRRHGVTFLELDGRVSEEKGPRRFTEHFYCFKAMPACRPEQSDNGGFDGEVLLTELTWAREYSSVRRVEGGRVILRESPYDPLVDVPVKRLVSMELAEGASKTSGEVLTSVPGAWLEPFLVQRYDALHPGVEVALASERSKTPSS